MSLSVKNSWKLRWIGLVFLSKRQPNSVKSNHQVMLSDFFEASQYLHLTHKLDSIIFDSQGMKLSDQIFKVPSPFWQTSGRQILFPRSLSLPHVDALSSLSNYCHVQDLATKRHVPSSGWNPETKSRPRNKTWFDSFKSPLNWASSSFFSIDLRATPRRRRSMVLRGIDATVRKSVVKYKLENIKNCQSWAEDWNENERDMKKTSWRIFVIVAISTKWRLIIRT